MGFEGLPLAKNKIILGIKKFTIRSNNLNTLKSIGFFFKGKALRLPQEIARHRFKHIKAYLIVLKVKPSGYL